MSSLTPLTPEAARAVWEAAAPGASLTADQIQVSYYRFANKIAPKGEAVTATLKELHDECLSVAADMLGECVCRKGEVDHLPGEPCKGSTVVHVYSDLTGGRRHRVDVQAMTAIFIDCDENHDFRPLINALGLLGIAYLWSESTSSARGARRWHIVLPLAERIVFPGDHHHAAYAKWWADIAYRAVADALFALGGMPPREWDDSCKSVPRIRYVGTRRDGYTQPRQVCSGPGRLLSLPALLQALGIPTWVQSVAQPVAGALAADGSLPTAGALPAARPVSGTQRKGPTPGHSTGSLMILAFGELQRLGLSRIGQAIDRGDGRAAHAVLCPWRHQHGESCPQRRGGFHSSTVIFDSADADTDGGFSCLHQHSGSAEGSAHYTAADVLGLTREVGGIIPDTSRWGGGDGSAATWDAAAVKVAEILDAANKEAPTAATVEAQRDALDALKVAHSRAVGKAPVLATPAAAMRPAMTPPFPRWGTTDVANGERLAYYFRGRLRYDVARRVWLRWDGRVWIADDDGARTCAAAVARAIYGEVAALQRLYERLAGEPYVAPPPRGRGRPKKGETDEAPPLPPKVQALADRIAALQAWAQRSESDAQVRACRTHAQDAMRVTPGELDQHAWLLAVANGVINLETGSITPHDPAHLITHLAPVVYDAAATCPRWERFVAEAMCQRPEMIAYLQRIAGYALTGDVAARAMWIHVGAGSNGKGTFFELLRDLMGEHSVGVSMSLLTSSSDKASAGMESAKARLCGHRLAVANEGAAEAVLDDRTVKEITGRDRVTAKFMAKDYFDFVPSHKLHYETNELPQIRGEDWAIWSRVRIVMWDFQALVPDMTLADKLRDELPGILNWLLRGVAEYRRGGLDDPPHVVATKEALRAAADSLGRYLKECCTAYPERVTDANANSVRHLYHYITVAALRDGYVRWCDEHGVQPTTVQRYIAALKTRGFAERVIKVSPADVCSASCPMPAAGRTVRVWLGVREGVAAAPAEVQQPLPLN